jgi:hypothetical protein
MKISKTTLAQWGSLVAAFAVTEAIFLLVYPAVTYIRPFIQGIVGAVIFFIPIIASTSRVHYLLAGSVLFSASVINIFLIKDNIYAPISSLAFLTQLGIVTGVYFWLRKYWSEQ